MTLLVLCSGVLRSQAALPTGWSDADIGSPGLSGSASFDNNTWTVTGGGGDIWDLSDQFHYAYTAATDSMTLVARVESILNTDSWAKGGVMFRDSTAANSAFAMVVVTPGNGVSFQWRDTTGNSCGYSQLGNVSAPSWVKLVRAGTQFTAFSSSDGSAWTSLGPAQTINIGSAGLAGLAVTAHNNGTTSTATFTSVSAGGPPAPPVFGIYRQLWSGIPSGGTLDVLTNTALNPNWPDNPDASFTRVFSAFETELNRDEQYGQRLRTYVVPPTNGNYTFWISSDDSSELYLSSDEQPGNMRLVASVSSWTESRQWSKEGTQQSAPLYLEANRRYYLEARMQEGGGGDNLAVRWQLPGGALEEPLADNSTAGTRLVAFNAVANPPGIFAQTTNLSVLEGATAKAWVLVTNGAPVAYHWRLNGAALPGNSQAACSLTNVTIAQDGQLLTCVASNSSGTATSSQIRLSVLRDSSAPTVVRCINIGASTVQIVFSETLDPSSAVNVSNYVFTNGLPVTAASLVGDGTVVALTTGPLVYGSNYTVLLTGLKDRAGIPNTIAPGTPAYLSATPYAMQEIGSPPTPGVSTSVAGGMDISASGADISGTADQFSFSYQARSGDFDVQVRVAGLSPSDVWAKAGLMAREALEPGSRFAATLTTPAMIGSLFVSRANPSSPAASSGSFPANYPNTWLRLKRAGNLFTGFASYDGHNWTQLGSATIVMPNNIYLGFAVSSHSSQTTTAQIRDISDVSNPVLATSVNPHEPLGPSSRKTPIVISEIMYKPAPRTDGQNLEFIELYNSNPWSEDVAGYHLAADGLTYTFPAGATIPGGGFCVIAAAPISLEKVYGLSAVLGPYAGTLKTSDTLKLLDEQGAVLLTVPYSNNGLWPVAPDATGHSLVLANPTYGEEDPKAWDVSESIGGSPGSMEAFRPDPLRNVVINEFLAHTDPPDYDYVELYNHANQAVDISGCIVTDDFQTNRFIVPSGTVIPARGFVYFNELTLNFRLSANGENLYFINPTRTRVIDAVHFKDQENGVSSGRCPDGAPDFYRLAAKTPGASNGALRISDIVINELMYEPISGDDDDQFVELYNQGSAAVDLSGWTLSGAIAYTIPANTTLASNGYLVVARNAARLRTNYSNLNLNNCLGDFSGKLKHGGCRVALNMPDTLVSTNSAGTVSTNLLHITVDEVTYSSGGRWGQWSAGGGSSLELLDARSNHRLPSNWADSDETQKSAWANLETTGTLDNGSNYDPSIDRAQLGLLDTGECLVDNVEVRSGTSGANLVLNSDFESGSANWSLQGDHSRSKVENGGYGSSSKSLHVRASNRMFTGANSCQMTLASNTFGDGQTATLRLKARWLRGNPELLMRLNGNWLELAGMLPVPKNLGTPGARNSRALSKAGPALYAVSHNPPVPAANQAVVVTVRVHDSHPLSSLTLNYRLDPSSSYSAVQMKDDGTGGDAIAGDGLFSATIPGQNANALVAFYLSAADTQGALTRFPAATTDYTPIPECVVMFGDGNPVGSFGVYHLWLTKTNADRWSQLSDLSNESHDCTMVSGNRVIYNVKARWAGSPYHQGFDTPSGNGCHYKWIFPEDDKFLGATSFNKIHQPGNGAGDDGSIQREQTANLFLRSLRVPWLYRRHVAVYVNGVRRGSLMEDAQTPDADVVEERFPNDSDGWLYKMQPWFEFGPEPQGLSIPFNNASWCNLMPYTSGGTKKVARYRWNYLVRRTPTTSSDFTNVFSMVDAASSYGSPNYVANMENMADMENWMRVFAANHAAGNWDAFGCQNSQNLYGYIGRKGTKYSLLMFDFNIVLGNSGSWGPGENLFTGNGSDPNVQNIYNEPTFRRMYWRALQELVNGPLDVANSGPVLDAKYSAFVANGLTVENPASIKSWLTAARNSIASQMAAENTAAFTVDTSVQITNDVAYVTGRAPINIKTISFNGAEYPITWTGVTTWRAAIPLKGGSNQFTVVGLDIKGQPVADATKSLTVNYGGTVPSPVGFVVLNEIMYNPVAPDAQFVELFNRSTTVSFDLSGYELRGLNYTFPPGSVIAPNQYLVLAANRPAFAAAYGALVPVFDTFSGTLQNNGETLSLVKPGANGAPDTVITRVRYDSTAPWPAAANGFGPSLQLVDSRQDNWRCGNWTAVNNDPSGPQWVFVSTNIPATSSTLYLYLNSAGDVYIDDLKVTQNAAPNLVANGDFESPLSGSWTATANFSGSTISTSVKHSGNSSLHLVASAAGSGSGNSVYQTITPALVNGQTYTLSFWYLQNVTGVPLTVRLSSSSNPVVLNTAPDSQTLALYTPGSPNSVAASLDAFPALWINEVQAENVSGLTNRLGQRSAWLELFNPGTTQVSLNGLYLSTNYTNLTAWAFPTDASIGAGQFKVIFADAQPGLSTAAELHTSFSLPTGQGSIALSRLGSSSKPEVLDFVDYKNVSPDRSYGSIPDAQSFERRQFTYVTPGATNNGASAPLTIAINEWMADNSGTLVDPADNQFEDWFELYNHGPDPVDLSGYFLSDNATNKFQFQIPGNHQYIVPSKGYLLVWADNETGQNATNRSDLHVNFKLDKLGEALGLYGADGATIDYISFGPQLADVSQGRTPDGGSTIADLGTPTPRSANPTGNNSAPSITSPGDKVAFVGQKLTFTLSASDPDQPSQTLTFSLAQGAPAGAGIDPSSGSFLWVPTTSQGGASYAVTVVVTDNGSPSLSASTTFNVNVPTPNRAPTLATLPDKSTLANSPVSFTASASDPDSPAQSLTFSLGANTPLGASITADGQFSWTPTPAQAPSTNQITIIVTDNGTPPLSDSKSFTITVSSLNTAPTIAPIEDRTVKANALVSFTISATDSDQPAQSISFGLSGSAPAGASVGVTSGVFSWTPTAAQAGTTNRISVMATDSGSPQLSATKSFTIVVLPLNKAPVLPAQSDRTVPELTQMVVTNTATDPDVPSNAIAYQLLNAPAGAVIDTNGVIRWTPTETQGPATNLFTTIATDDGDPAQSATNVFTVVVQEVNSSPTLAPISEYTVVAGALLTFTVTASDSDSPAQALSFSLEPGAPAGASLDAHSGLFTWTPSSNQAPSTNRFGIRVTDDGVPPLSDSRVISIIVSNAPATLTLEWSPAAAGPFTTEPSAVIDTTARSITVPARNGPCFYRISAPKTTRIKEIRVSTTSVYFTYE